MSTAASSESEPTESKPVSHEITAQWGPGFAVWGGLLLFALPQLLLAVLLLPLIASQPDLQERITGGNDVFANFAIYALAEILTFGLLYWLLKYKGYSWGQLGLKRKGLSKLWLLVPAFVAYFFTTLLLQVIASFFVGEEILQADQELGFENANGAQELIMAFIALVVVAPFVEEILFRGFMYAGLRRHGLTVLVVAGGLAAGGVGAFFLLRTVFPDAQSIIQIWGTLMLMGALFGLVWSRRTELQPFLTKLYAKKQANIWAAIFLSSALFGLAHGQLNVGLDTFALGIFLAYVYEKSGTIWLPVLLHANKNLLAFVLLFIIQV